MKDNNPDSPPTPFFPTKRKEQTHPSKVEQYPWQECDNVPTDFDSQNGVEL